MIKKLKLFLCVILTVILPFSFAGCKSDEHPSEPNNPASAPTNPQPSAGDDEDVFDGSEVLTVIKTTSSEMSAFVDSLNNASVVSDENLSNTVAEKMPAVLHYAYYPEMVLTLLTENVSDKKTFELDKTYYYNAPGGYDKYFKTTMLSSNKFEFIYSTSDDVSDSIVFGRFVLEIDKNGIKTITISRLNTKQKSALVEFIEASLDFRNKTLECTMANLNADNTTSEKLLNKLKNNQITEDNGAWSYADYAKIQFGQNRSCESNSNAKEKVINNINKYGFLDAFTQKTAFENEDKNGNPSFITLYDDRLSNSLDMQHNYQYKNNKFEEI